MLRWCTIALLTFAIPASAEEVVRDGITHVLNSETPRDGVLEIKLEQLWVRGDESDDLLFGVVNRLLVDESTGEVYALDSQLHEIQVFDSDGGWLRSIGREGEGPAEFRNPGDMFLGPDGQIGVVQIFPGRVVRMSKTGDPGSPFEPGKDQGFQVFYVAVGTDDRVVLSGAGYGGGGGSAGTQTEYLKAFVGEGEEVAVYHTNTIPIQFGGMEFDEKNFSSFARRWAVSAEGQVAVAREFDAYTVHIHDADGTVLRVIERPDYKPVQRTDKEKARFQRLYDTITSWNQGSTFKVSDSHQAISQLNYRPDGTLWILSGAEQWRGQEGVMAVWDVFDADGHYIRQVRMLGEGDPVEDGYFFSSNRVYQVTDLFSAAMSSMGGDEEDAGAAESEPVRLVAWKLESGISSR